MSHIWIQPNDELRHRAAAGHARDSLAFSHSIHTNRPLSINSGKSSTLRRGFYDAWRRPVPMQKGKGLEETEGGGKERTPPTGAWKFKLFRYSFLVEEESLVQFDAEGGDGCSDEDQCRRKVLVVLSPERGSRTYEMVLRREKTTLSVENAHL